MINKSEKIKEIEEISPPSWAKFVKTGASKQRTPVDEDWWFIRSFSILKKIEKYGPVGVNRLSKLYGGRKNRGNKPTRKYSGSRNIVRKILQQLQKSGLIKQVEKPTYGKFLTKEGKEFLNKSKEVEK